MSNYPEGYMRRVQIVKGFIDEILEYFWKYNSNKLQRILRSCIRSIATLYGKYE